jgi:DNA-binding response OmpR family regulator
MDRIIPSQRSILVVADDPTIVGMVGLVFRAVGYRILIAGHGEEALACLSDDRPDVVLASVDLPGVSGAELTRRIRLIQGGDRVVVILIGDGDEPAGNAADGFVRQPFDPINVVDLIEALASGSGGQAV